jgi:hypothetical protein
MRAMGDDARLMRVQKLRGLGTVEARLHRKWRVVDVREAE